MNQNVFQMKKEKSLEELELIAFKKFIKLIKKEVSGLQRCMINTRIRMFNKQKGTSHFVQWTQVGESSLFTWEIIS